MGPGDRAVTPELRAARHRLRGLVGTEPGRDPMIDEGVDVDVRLVLDELDRYDAMEEAVRRDVRQVAAEAGFGPVPERVEATYTTAGPHGQCEGCGCCVASGCHRFADATCPTNSLGDSVCPCTED